LNFLHRDTKSQNSNGPITHNSHMPRVRARLFTLRACDFFDFSQFLGVEFAVVFVAAAPPFRRACHAEADSSRRGAALPLLCLPIICTHTGNILFLPNRAAAFSGRHKESSTPFQKTSCDELEKQKPRSSPSGNSPLPRGHSATPLGTAGQNGLHGCGEDAIFAMAS